MIRIRSHVDGFRRCGVPHTSAWKEHEDNRFTPEQLKILEAEPMLQVERVLPELKLEAAPKESLAGGDVGKAAPEGGMTKAQITAKLTELGVEIPKKANKPELQALLDEALDKKPSPALFGNGDKEAVMPLTRDSNGGNLAVSAQGGEG